MGVNIPQFMRGIIRKGMLCFFFLSFLCPTAFAAELTVNLIAVNATDEVKKDFEVRYVMPKELKPEDVLDTGELELKYDVDAQVYVITGNVLFQPKETKKFQIKVNDVWQIPDGEVELLQKQLDDNLLQLENHESYEDAKIMAEKLREQLTSILGSQAAYSKNIERRIEEYRANLKVLQTLRDRIYSLDFLKHQSKTLNEAEENTATIKFKIEVKNPTNIKQTIKLKHFIPNEMRETDIISSEGFSVRYDEEKGLPYLSKDEEFEPGQVRKYEIVMKDIWQFPVKTTDDLQGRLDDAMPELEGSIYKESAKFLQERIMKNLSLIRESALKKVSVQQHIGIYRVNQDRFKLAEEDFNRIEDMINIVRAKKLEEIEKGKVKNVLQKLKALRGISALSEALFKKTISITVTWRIIMGTIVFMAVFTALHFFIWAKRSKRMGEELAPKGGEGIVEVPKPGEEKEEDD